MDHAAPRKALTVRTPTIRPAAAADAPRLPAIEQDAAQLFETLPGLEWVARMPVADVAAHSARIAARLTWVSTGASGNPFGFVTIERHGDTIHIAELSVNRAAQGNGHGRGLMDAVIDTARHAGASALTLTTFRDVAWNRPFYERLGFSVLDDRNVGPRLSAVLQAEAKLGFDPATRCAMQRLLRG